jgi:acetyl-CoA synthetase
MVNMVDYMTTYREFKWDVPEFYNFGFDVIDKWAQKNPNKTALITVDTTGKSAQKHTFHDLSTLSNKFANVVRKLGIKKGDRVFLMLPRIPEWYVTMIGLIKLGILPMPATVLCTPKDVEYRINKAEAVMAITDLENIHKIEKVQANCPTLKVAMIVGGSRKGFIDYDEEMSEASSELDINEIGKTRSDDPLIIYFTSGTESYPKMVIHTHSYPLGHIVTAKFVQDLKQDDLHWTVADTGWAKTAWGKLFGQWIVGCTVLQHNLKGKFNPRLVLEIIEKYKVTTFCAPPTIYRMLILEDLKKYNLSSLRHCLSAGEPLNPKIIKVWKEATGNEIYDFYGQTETVALLANYPSLPLKYGSMGKPTPGHVIKILDDAGHEVPVNEEGYIALKLEPNRSPGLFKEYWKSPESMAKVFKNGWYYTGDKAYMDADGYFWFVGRADDVIKSSGYRIGPFEVESALITHPAVLETGVVGHPDPIRGQIVKAFVVLKEGFEPSDQLIKELQDHVKKVTAPYKYPRKIEFVKELPKTISGKIRRAELRKWR